MTDYKAMFEKLFSAHCTLKTGLNTLAKRDEYGELKQLLEIFYYELNRIDIPMRKRPLKAKVRRICRKNKE